MTMKVKAVEKKLKFTDNESKSCREEAEVYEGP